MQMINSIVHLNNGIEMPCFGLGVFRAGEGGETQNAVKIALDIGYRLFDTASMYGNEGDVGQAVNETVVPRDEIFVTTKLWNSDHGYVNTIRAFDKSIRRLNLEYVDLYLIHWPVENKRKESWKALITLLNEGKCRAIGVSNFTIKHLEELLSDSPVVPAVNQVEFSPFLYQKELLEFCRKNIIQLEGYCPLTRGKMFSDKTLKYISHKYDKTPAQILIRWSLQHNVITIPKSANKERIRENAAVFDFNILDEDMEKLDSLNENLRVSWDPTTVR